MSHRSKRPFGKIDLTAFPAGAATATAKSNTTSTATDSTVSSNSNGSAPAEPSTAALIAAVLSRGSTESLPELGRRPATSPPVPADMNGRLSAATSEDSLSESTNSTTAGDDRKPRRPRPKPINLAQVNAIKSTGQLAQLATGNNLNSASTATISSTASLLNAVSATSTSTASVDNCTIPPADRRQQTSTAASVVDDRPTSPTTSATAVPAISFQVDVAEKDLDNLEELGMGAGGTVYRVRHRPTNTIMAKKIIHQLDATTSKEILRELQILNKCQSPHIISFYGAYEQQGDLCICMEFMDVGSLEKIGKVAGQLTEKVIAKLAVSVVEGLVYLYESFRIVHRDIKPSNILVNSSGKIKLCDFGVSGILENSVANTFVGTGAYMSPERIQGAKYATQCDSWSLGLTLLEMALGRYPFSPETGGNAGDGGGVDPGQMSIFELLQHIISDPTPRLPRPSDPASQGGGQFSDACCDFIEVTLEKDPQKRPTPRQLLSHPFVVGAQSVHMDMAAWARKFLDPNLDPVQSRRWSVSQKQKRESWLNLVERRKSGVRGASGLMAGVDALAHKMSGARIQPPNSMDNVSSRNSSNNNSARSLEGIPASPPTTRREMK